MKEVFEDLTFSGWDVNHVHYEVRVVTAIGVHWSTLEYTGVHWSTLEYIDCCEYPQIGMMMDGFMAVGIFTKKRFDRIIGI